MTKSLTPRERNERWANNNTKLKEILDMNVGQDKLLDENEVHKKTLTLVELYAFPGRIYKHKRLERGSSMYYVRRVA